MPPRYLTKSRWKLGRECPTKLYYTKKEEYFDAKTDDDFLKALAEGGFQVGELAKLYYPGGINIDELEYAIALAKTAALLSQEHVIIYEAAFLYENLFIRADILVKEGKKVKLVEVKAKSFDPTEDPFTTSKGIASAWLPYLEDIAFQKYVVSRACPDYQVSAFLMLADKSKQASVDGLNQRFMLYEEGGRKAVRVKGPIDKDVLGDHILTSRNVDAEIDHIWGEEYDIAGEPASFEALVSFFSGQYEADEKIVHPLGSKRASCEFKATVQQMTEGLRSGFHECWRALAFFREGDFAKPSVLDIWDFRKKDTYISDRKYFQHDALDELRSEKDRKEGLGTGLSRPARQLLQVEKSTANDNTHYIDREGLAACMEAVRYPLHFIDFETTTVAIPFHKGRRPYEQIAFQFSHHVMRKDGSIEHKGQWIHGQTGVFPNFDFVRALQKELQGDDGTIFKYASHENTILNAIYGQLRASLEPDRELLCQWIKSVTHQKGGGEKWEGERDMVDLREIVVRHYYNPLTNGSNSIKRLLPAVLETSAHLQEKYSRPVYGTAAMKSFNFCNQAWIRYDENGSVLNPYDLLAPIQGVKAENSTIADGGAAMTAFAKIQFTEMTEEEREKTREALLKYCELDTFAMVLIWEAWKAWLC